jgi:pimeloyl-ACP methyl ester carboxylesterase
VPKVIANNYETHYELDDFTDPWKPAETIVIQHGFGRSSRFWYHWVPLLARHYRVIRRDLRGHGQSADPGPNHEWSVEELLDDMKGFLDALNLEQVHYVGESIGGLLGIACAVRWPERFKTLTLCAGAVVIPRSIQRHFAIGYADWHTALGALGSGGWAKALMERGGLAGGDVDPVRQDWIVKEWGKTPTHVLQGFCHMVPGADVTPLLPEIRVPTLLLAPARSGFNSLQEQMKVYDAIPGARIAVIEGRGHEIYVDEPEACTDALLKFLRTFE